MKNFIIFLLLAALVAENVYIYRNPESVCEDLKDKMDNITRTVKKKIAEGIIDDPDLEVMIKEEVSTQQDVEVEN